MMRSLALAYFLLSFVPSTSGYGGHNDQAHPQHGRKVDDLEPADIDQLARGEVSTPPFQGTNRDRDLSAAVSCEDICTQCIEIITYFHRVTSDRLLTEHDNDFAAKKQLFVLNDRYKTTPFYFSLESITDIIYDSERANDGLEYWHEIGSEVRQGPLTTLNIYVVDNIGDVDGVPLKGLAIPPRARSPLPIDGVMLRADTLPNGLPRSEGITAVHEVGHWFGTYDLANMLLNDNDLLLTL